MKKNETCNYSKQVEKLAEETKKLREQLEELRNNPTVSRNPFNAGRKKHDGKWTKQYIEFEEFVRKEMSIAEIMETMKISRSTYFRLLKEYKKNQEKEI